jgi:predicted transcriptional regulator
MSKRVSFEIKKKILELAKNEKTFAELERKINTGFNTIKSNCIELEKFGFVTIKQEKKHEKNGRPFFKIKTTEQGINFLKNQ